MSSKLPKITKEKFRFSTLEFIFIIAYVNLFQLVFGPENSIVGVIFTIMMSASMVRDLTATPVRHLILQSAVLVWMAVAAYLVVALPASLSFTVNFVTLLLILYAYTFEYSSHMYFPYILSYLFLIFISPVNAAQLPRRMLGMLAGAVSIILYQLIKGRKRAEETARDVLSEMIDDLCLYIDWRLGETTVRPNLSDTRHKLCRLSQTVYDRRKRILCVSEAGYSMIAAGRGLEHLLILLHELPETLSTQEREFLTGLLPHLRTFRSFLHQEISELPPLDDPAAFTVDSEKTSSLFYNSLIYVRDRLLHMSDPEKKRHYKKTALSLEIRLQAALGFSQVRAAYAFRTALLLALSTLLVQHLALPHGKWFLFTLASVSLPYADDVPLKIRKRILATITGGLAAVVIYSLISSAAGRMAAMMLSGYLSFYFKDYAQTFACSTIGALGGAVFMSAFGFWDVAAMFLVRIGYILAGALTGFVANCVLFPYSRAKATKQLWIKYKKIADLLTAVSSSSPVDPQLYYHLVIQAHLLEEKLTQNARLESWKEFPELLENCREQIRRAHRSLAVERADAPVLKPGHLI